MKDNFWFTHLGALLSEFERRRLHLGLGFPSTFDYCVKVLRLTEHETYNRIEVARASRKFPELLLKLADGCLSLTAIRLLGPHLTPENFDRLTREAEGQRIEGVKLLIAKLKPQPPVPAVIRKLPASNSPGAAVESTLEVGTEASVSLEQLVERQPRSATPATHRPVVAPLSESHYRLQVTISASARERLAQIQALMRHRLPSGDPAATVEHALEVLHAELLKQKAAEVARPRQGKAASEAKGRYIPASVKREVWRRDQGRCAFVASDGRRCGSEDGVEFHHMQPFAVGGQAAAANIEMRCRSHNGFEWQQHVDEETLNLMRR